MSNAFAAISFSLMLVAFILLGVIVDWRTAVITVFFFSVVLIVYDGIKGAWERTNED